MVVFLQCQTEGQGVKTDYTTFLALCNLILSFYPETCTLSTISKWLMRFMRFKRQNGYSQLCLNLGVLR